MIDWSSQLPAIKRLVWWICRNGRQQHHLVSKWPFRKLIRETRILGEICERENGFENL